MVVRARHIWLPLVALLLAAQVRAQGGGAARDDLCTPAPVIVCQPPGCNPSLDFQFDWLWTTREGLGSSGPDFIGGAQATGFQNLPGFNGSSGYRIQGSVRAGNWIFEGVWADFGGWDSSMFTTVNGVAFNASAAAAGGDWAGRNYINGNTYFAPIYNAASMGAPQNTINDQSGLGPSKSFGSDPLPQIWAGYHSEMQMFEANVKCADTFLDGWGGGLRLGAGFANVSFNEVSQLVLTGTFRAVSNVGGATVSIPDSALTSSNGGNLYAYAGGGTGFNNGVTDGSGIPSQLRFGNQTTTSNELNGAQIVMDGNLLRWGSFDVGTKLQAGLFDNFAHGTIAESYSETNKDGSAYGRLLDNSQHQLAFMGGVALNLGYHLNDYVVLRGGYEALFLSGLALASDQINGVNGNYYRVQTSGSAVIDGAHLGVEVTY